ncbi:MAG: CTP synthase [Dehalococcoidia bacterium]
MIEYARNVAGTLDAGHAEYDPRTPNPLVMPVACPVPDRAAGDPGLSGRLRIAVEPYSLAGRTLGRAEIEEGFFCNYELNPDAEQALTDAGLVVSGRGDRGEVRIVELPDHRWFLASLFLPQHSSTVAEPHPLILAFLQASHEVALSRQSSPRIGSAACSFRLGQGALHEAVQPRGN